MSIFDRSLANDKEANIQKLKFSQEERKRREKFK